MFSSDAARRRPYPLTPHHSLLIAHNSSLKMFYCSFVEKTHRSSLTTHCSKAVSDPRLCRRRMCEGRLNTTGSRTRGYSPFRASRPSDASTYLRKGENVWKLRLRESRTKLDWVMPSVSNLDKVKDGNMNSRGLSSLRLYNVRI